MRLLTRWIIGLVLAVPAPALAQALKPADLIGTWVSRSDKAQYADVLTLQADSTWTFQRKQVDGEALKDAPPEWRGTLDGKSAAQNGRWALVQDTLRAAGLQPIKVLRKDQQLILDLGPFPEGSVGASQGLKHCAVFDRVDPSKLVPPKPQAQQCPA